MIFLSKPKKYSFIVLRILNLKWIMLKMDVVYIEHHTVSYTSSTNSNEKLSEGIMLSLFYLASPFLCVTETSLEQNFDISTPRKFQLQAKSPYVWWPFRVIEWKKHKRQNAVQYWTLYKVFLVQVCQNDNKGISVALLLSCCAPYLEEM